MTAFREKWPLLHLIACNESISLQVLQDLEVRLVLNKFWSKLFHYNAISLHNLPPSASLQAAATDGTKPSDTDIPDEGQVKENEGVTLASTESAAQALEVVITALGIGASHDRFVTVPSLIDSMT